MSAEEVLSRIRQAIGIADFALDVAPTLTPEILETLIAAEKDATAANVEAVFAAYYRAGVMPPAKLAAQLLYENEQQHPEDTIRGDLTPWLIAIAIGIFLLFRKGKTR